MTGQGVDDRGGHNDGAESTVVMTVGGHWQNSRIMTVAVSSE